MVYLILIILLLLFVLFYIKYSCEWWVLLRKYEWQNELFIIFALFTISLIIITLTSKNETSILLLSLLIITYIFYCYILFMKHDLFLSYQISCFMFLIAFCCIFTHGIIYSFPIIIMSLVIIILSYNLSEMNQN